MNKMIFRDILIVDIINHVARYTSFMPGLNVVTSKENHVGKSSLLKSLYFALGAEVEFDNAWDKNSKIVAVRFIVNYNEYRIVRYNKKFAVFKNDFLFFMTESVTHDLSSIFEEIFDFSIYLLNKSNDKRIVLAPPAFTFMPYYIDQDKGWSNMYKSFKNMDQFEKSERLKSLYYHLGIYNKDTIESMSECDRLKDEIEKLKDREKSVRSTIENLLLEIQNLIIVDNEEDFEKQLSIPNEQTKKLVNELGKARNHIQETQTKLYQHEYQYNMIKKYYKTHKNDSIMVEKNIRCPKCGYKIDDNLDMMIRKNYNTSNEIYIIQLLELRIKSLKCELHQQKDEYVKLLSELKNKEKVFNKSQELYQVYIKHKGLGDTVKKYQYELEQNIQSQKQKVLRVKSINKLIRETDRIKVIEAKYIDFVKSNIIKLNAWHPSYEDKIRLLKPISAQGSLESKIVLSQYIGLFQTMQNINSSAIRFPFVIDSPRGQEASNSSSKEILKIISTIDFLPQIILATVDYNKYMDDSKSNVILLEEDRRLLNRLTYENRKQEIEILYNLMCK